MLSSESWIQAASFRKLRIPVAWWLALAFCAMVAIPAVNLVPARPALAQAQDPVRGEELFGTFCMACHNEHGILGPPMIEDTGYFIRAGIPGETMGMLLQQPVRVKREGSFMPAYTPDQVSDADLNDIGAFLASHHTPPEVPPAMGVAANGAEPYAQYCAMCHGANGEGANGMLPVAFMAADFKQHNLPPQLMLAFVMLASRSGSVKDMPVIGEDMLSDQQLADIAAYIWEMPVPQMPGGPVH